MTLSLRLLFALLVLSGMSHAKDPRVLEITSDVLRAPGSVEFLADKSSAVAVQVQQTANKSFDWVDIPEEAKAARVKVGELATEAFPLADSGTTLLIIGQPTLIQDANGVPKATLGATVKTDRVPAPVDSTGWVFFGSVKLAAGTVPATAPWSALYLVQPPKTVLNVNREDTFAAVKAVAVGSRLRVDFPLIIRKFDAAGNIDRSGDTLTIRAGQYVEIKSLKDPDPKGAVYAEVKVVTP